MAVDPQALRIVHYPAPVLRQKAEAVGEVTEEVRAVAERMIELMHEAPGVGLAAPQVGLSWRLFVANPTGEAGDDRVFIDPVFSEASRETESSQEGCLSLPGIQAEVRRPVQITITATGLDGQRFTLTSDAFPARVWQHEYDHLEGVLLLDKMTPMDRKVNQRAIREMETS